jgi:hypothetical protein
VPAGPRRLFTRDEDGGHCCCREWRGATAWQRPGASRGQAIRGRSRTRDSFSALQFRQLIVKPCAHIPDLVLDAAGPLRLQSQSRDDLLSHMT